MSKHKIKIALNKGQHQNVLADIFKYKGFYFAVHRACKGFDTLSEASTGRLAIPSNINIKGMSEKQIKEYINNNILDRIKQLTIEDLNKKGILNFQYVPDIIRKEVNKNDKII